MEERSATSQGCRDMERNEGMLKPYHGVRYSCLEVMNREEGDSWKGGGLEMTLNVGNTSLRLKEYVEHSRP